MILTFISLLYLLRNSASDSKLVSTSELAKLSHLKALKNLLSANTPLSVQSTNWAPLSFLSKSTGHASASPWAENSHRGWRRSSTHSRVTSLYKFQGHLVDSSTWAKETPSLRLTTGRGLRSTNALSWSAEELESRRCIRSSMPFHETCRIKLPSLCSLPTKPKKISCWNKSCSDCSK